MPRYGDIVPSVSTIYNQKVNITGEALNWVISLTKMREEKDGRHVTFTVPGGGGYVIIGKIGDDPLEIFWG
jgi:hypothetical protein